jgi:hypothetical protein
MAYYFILNVQDIQQKNLYIEKQILHKLDFKKIYNVTKIKILCKITQSYPNKAQTTK